MKLASDRSSQSHRWRWGVMFGGLLAVLVAVVGLGATAILSRRGTQAAQITHSPRPTPTPTQPPSVSLTGNTPSDGVDLPQHLLIPSIGVNASVEQVAVTETHDVQVPQIQPFDDVGWYALGPKPGQTGNAVIDGHLDRKDGSPAVFWRLRDLQPGQKILVQDASGHTYTFHIDRIEHFPVNQAPLAEIFGPSSGIHLNLITCTGVWIPAQHQTTERLVVYATLD